MTDVSFSRAIADNAERRPDGPAVSCGGASVTWATLESSTNRLARAYRALGVAKGSFVTIGLPNSIEFLEACVATWKLGATPQPISHRLPERERRAIIELADPALVVGIGEEAERRSVPEGFVPDATLSDARLPDVVAERWKAPTSGGSTGTPKLIVATEPGVVDPDSPYLRQRPGGSVCIPGPLYHNGPFTFASTGLMRGCHVSVLPRFDAERTLAVVEDSAADWLLLVPTMMQRIIRLPEDVRARYDVRSLRTVLHMAAPCPAWLKEAWIEWLGGEVIYELYAGTEAQAFTLVRGDEWSAHRGTVGRPVSGEMRIQDPETLAVLPPGEVGEVFMRSERKTYDYVGADARRSDDGWESLGDMGHLDEDGYLYLADRRTDMILSGGANIYPAEVEAAIDEHPDVVSSAVIGLPDDDLGNRVHAIVHGAPGLDLDELRDFLATRIVRYKVPRSFELVDQTLRGDDGKVRRGELRAERTVEAGRA